MKYGKGATDFDPVRSRGIPRRADRLKCSCNTVAEVIDTTKKFYVKCPVCGITGPERLDEKTAISGWEEKLRGKPA
jgi:hypothetical protein